MTVQEVLELIHFPCDDAGDSLGCGRLSGRMGISGTCTDLSSLPGSVFLCSFENRSSAISESLVLVCPVGSCWRRASCGWNLHSLKYTSPTQKLGCLSMYASTTLTETLAEARDSGSWLPGLRTETLATCISSPAFAALRTMFASSWESVMLAWSRPTKNTLHLGFAWPLSADQRPHVIICLKGRYKAWCIWLYLALPCLAAQASIHFRLRCRWRRYHLLFLLLWFFSNIHGRCPVANNLNVVSFRKLACVNLLCGSCRGTYFRQHPYHNSSSRQTDLAWFHNMDRVGHYQTRNNG